ncbi:hypothetical protein [Paenibacillus daejeonensis]|uniref:hypothetical protein n=1 Tax=Paenibacillus daejeonensis TaxID=135193 RepID=UPI00035D0424|nr:hypothetical protein [Paenibacillus daejeonensis]
MLIKLCLIMTIVFSGQFTPAIKADQSPIDDGHPILGPVKSFEDKFSKKVLLPKYIPFKGESLRASYSEDQENVTVTYYNTHTYQMMNVMVYPAKKEMRLSQSGDYKEIKLASGETAFYLSSSHMVANMIQFVKKDLEYIIGVSKPVDLEMLKRVADSLVYNKKAPTDESQ